MASAAKLKTNSWTGIAGPNQLLPLLSAAGAFKLTTLICLTANEGKSDLLSTWPAGISLCVLDGWVDFLTFLQSESIVCWMSPSFSHHRN